MCESYSKTRNEKNLRSECTQAAKHVAKYIR